MNSGRTIVVEDGNRWSPAGVVIRGARETLGGAVTVVGSVGCVAGRLLDGAGAVLNTTAGAVSGTILLVGDILNTTGRVLGSTVSGLGNTLTMAGGLVSGGRFVDARGLHQPSPEPTESARAAASDGPTKPDSETPTKAPAARGGKPRASTATKTQFTPPDLPLYGAQKVAIAKLADGDHSC
jgi:hypothetical protein